MTKQEKYALLDKKIKDLAEELWYYANEDNQGIMYGLDKQSGHTRSMYENMAISLIQGSIEFEINEDA